MNKLIIAGIVLIAILVAGIGAYFVLNNPTTTPPAEKRLLRVQYVNAPYIDPAVGSDDASSSSFPNLYDTLIYIALTGEIKPDLATTWETTTDGKSWTFHLRQGVKFHNGAELTADDVKFSMDRLLTIGEGYSYIFAPYISSTQAVDKYTVQFNLKTTFGPFLSSLIRLYVLNKAQVTSHFKTSGSYGNLGDYGKEWLLSNDAGSGPYQIKKYNEGTSMVLERFPDYWGEYATLAPDEVTANFVADATAVKTAMQRRELEITDITEPIENLQAMSQTTGINLASFTHSWVWYYALNTKMAPTDDIHVRKAMAWATDYQTMIQSILPDSEQAVGPVLSALIGWNPNLFQYQQNLTKATEELALSKYANNISKYTIELHWCAEAPFEERGAIDFASNLAKIGIPIKVVKTPWLTMTADAGNLSTSPNISFFSTGANYPEAGSTLEARYTSKACGTWEQNEWLQNSTLDAEIQDALSTINVTERIQKYYHIQQEIVDMCPTIFLCEWCNKRAYQAYYVQWPAANVGGHIVAGYDLDARYISVNNEERNELLNLT